MHVDEALHLARERHTALMCDDVDLYAAADAEMAAHCARLLSLPADALSPADIAALNEILALETASSRVLAGMSVDVAARLSGLVARGRTNTAYLRSERSSVNPL